MVKELEQNSSNRVNAADARIRIPLDLQNWKNLPADLVVDLTWFHQYIIDHSLAWKEAEEALGYDRSTIYRVLRGNYEGSWEKIRNAITSFRRIDEQRGSIQKNEFVETATSKLVFAALDYALANNSITLIVGESRSGKTVSAKMWSELNNHGRSVFVTAPVVGGVKALLGAIAKKCGVPGTKHHRTLDDWADLIYRAFNRNRALVIDEAHRLVPADPARTPHAPGLEILRDIHDQTGCALALISTERLSAAMRKGAYQYEQLVGRIGMPVLVPTKIKKADVTAIVRQFVPSPTASLIEEMERIANSPGRLGIMVETLKVGSRIASKAKQTLDETHVRKAIAIRTQMSGGAE